jgi:hypothetical protein
MPFRAESLLQQQAERVVMLLCIDRYGLRVIVWPASAGINRRRVVVLWYPSQSNHAICFFLNGRGIELGGTFWLGGSRKL